MKRGWLRYVAACSGVAVLCSLPPAPARAEGNAGVHLHKTVDPLQLTINPGINVTLAVDRMSAIPADTLTYTAAVTNSTVTFGMGGFINAQAVASTDANVSYYWDQLEICSQGCGNGAPNPQWAAIATFETGQAGYQPVTPPMLHTGMTLSAQSVTRSGVIYPTAGDPILGTQISPNATATWTYLSKAVLTPAQITLLSDPARVKAIRNVLHFEVTERNTTAAQPYTDPETFSNPFMSTSNPGAISNITVTFTLPDGTTTVVGPAQVPALATLSPGGSVTATAQFKVPVPASRAAGETDSSYLARLMTLDGSALNATASASGTGFSGPRTATAPTVSTTLHLPIVTIQKSGPTEITAGNAEVNLLALKNIGGSPASGLVVTDSLPGGATGTVSGAPATLTVGQVGSAQATYTVPVLQAPGSLTDTAKVTWNDGNGNTYGPLSSSFTTNVKSSLANAKLTLSPTTAGPDIVGNSQAFTAHLVDGAGQPVPNQPIVLSITGANPGTQTVTTNTAGDAMFTYVGANQGTDQIQATLTVGTLQSNTVSVSWILPIKTVSTTLVNGTVYHGHCCAFSATPASTPVFTIQVPTINFNPPQGTVPHNPTQIGVFTRPMFDVTTDVAGNFTGVIELKGVDTSGVLHEAGIGDLFEFDMVLTGTLTIAASGNLTFNFFSDDGFTFGIRGATRVAGPLLNPPANMLTPFNSYPVMGAFEQPTAPVANNITVNFPAAGTYAYEIDYNECCSGQLALTLATNGTGLPPTGNISLTPFTIAPATVGQTQTFNASVMDASGVAIGNQAVVLNVTGANPRQLSSMTDAFGVANFSYQGASPGQDGIQASAQVSGVPELSNVVAMTWNPAPPAPSIGTPSPADGSVVTKPVAVTASIAAPTGQTIASWRVFFQALDPGPQVTIASGTGSPPATLATFDPTVLPNDTYGITVEAVASGGGVQSLTTTVVVLGNLKPGRYVTTFQDLSVPVGGFQMEVRRTYDSIDKSSGDFGVGWKVSVANFRVASNRILGAAGWTQYNKSCVLGLCFTAFKNSSARFVSVVFPDQHTEVFDFTPQGGTNIFFGCTPQFNARGSLGTSSTLQALDDTSCSYSGDGNLYGSAGLYSPKQFKLTTKDGRALVLDARTGLISETDRTGNSLSVSTTGVRSTLGPASSPTPGPSITFSRDGQGRITDINGPVSGQHLRYGYFASSPNELQTYTDASGHVSTYTYDSASGNLTLASDSSNQPIETLGYDSSGRLVSIASGSAPPTSITTSSNLQQQVFLDPSGNLTTVLTFDDMGDVIEQDQVFGGQPASQTLFTYDTTGRLTSVTDPLKHTTSATYDETNTSSNGNVLTTTDSANRTYTYQNYNAFGQPGTVLNPDGSVRVTYTYDATTGALTAAQQPGQNPTTYQYYPNGLPQSIGDPGGRLQQYTYDANGHVKTAADSQGKSVSFSVDAAGNVNSVTDQLGNPTLYQYNPDGSLAILTDGDHNTWQFFYDLRGRMKQIKDPFGLSTLYAYNSLGQLSQRTDRNGAITAFAYDVDGNLTQVARPNNDVVNFRYDPLSRLIEADNPNSHIDRTYDAASRLASESSCANTGSPLTLCSSVPSGSQPSVTMAYSWFPDNQLKSVTSSDAGVIQYTYDGFGRLNSITDPALGKTGYGYDNLGRVTSIARPNGVNDLLGYNQSGDLTFRDSYLNGALVARSDYAIDPVSGRRVSSTTMAGTTNYTYYGNGTLQSATHPAGSGIPNESYAYDAAGNRTSANGQTATFSGDRLLSDGQFNYKYDANGQLAAKTPVAGGTGTTYSWDAEGQLTSIAYPNGSTSSYRYDPFGRRIASVDPGGETRYVWNSFAVHADYSSQNQLLATYVPGPTFGAPLEQSSGSQTLYYLADGQNNPSALTTSSGQVVGTYAFNSFGVPQPGNASSNRYSFGGYQLDSASGLYYAGARYYDSTSGRFLSVDPQPSVNPYPYAQNDPVDLVDALGQQAFREFVAMIQRVALEAVTALVRVGCGLLNLLALVGLIQLATSAIGSNALGAAGEKWLGRAVGGLGDVHAPILDGARVPDRTLRVPGIVNIFLEAKNAAEIDARSIAQIRDMTSVGRVILITRLTLSELPAALGPLAREGLLKWVKCFP